MPSLPGQTWRNQQICRPKLQRQGHGSSRPRGSGSQLARSDAAVSESGDKVVPRRSRRLAHVGGGYSVGTPGAPLRIRGTPLGCRRRGGAASQVLGRLGAFGLSVERPLGSRASQTPIRRTSRAAAGPAATAIPPRILVSQADGQPRPDQLGDQPVGQRTQVRQPTPIDVVRAKISSSRRNATMPRGVTPCSTMPPSRRVGFCVEGRHE